MDKNQATAPLQLGQSKGTELSPNFDELSPQAILTHIRELATGKQAPEHAAILDDLLTQVQPLDFKRLAYSERVKAILERLEDLGAIDDKEQHTATIERDSEKILQRSKLNKDAVEVELVNLKKLKLQQKHFLILSIESVLKLAVANHWQMCLNNNSTFLYNGAFWRALNSEDLKRFLGNAAEQMGVQRFDARYHKFKDELLKQFFSTAYLPTPEAPKDEVLINLQNGTFAISPDSTTLRNFRPEDFITYQLPFEYNAQAQAPIFEKYLNRVLPDIDRQKVLAEYMGFVFIRHGSDAIKEEKALVLYGTGANGKSVFFEVINALLGKENVSSFSLQSLTNETGYQRAEIATKLLNYASELNSKLESNAFKLLVSGEPIEARSPYGRPFTMTNYAKLIFNCNELPKDVEHTTAFFRRWLIVPFDETIPTNEQDKQLHQKIIQSELSGVFNWVLEGLKRLLEQKRFTHCDAAQQAIDKYKKEADPVKLFLEDNGYERSTTDYTTLKELYAAFKSYCNENGYRQLTNRTFSTRLQSDGFEVQRKTAGNVVFIANDQPF